MSFVYITTSSIYYAHYAQYVIVIEIEDTLYQVEVVRVKIHCRVKLST